MKGWKQDITKIQDYNALRDEAKDYIAKIEELTEIKITRIGVGQNRNQTIKKAA
jgi:adenylosuccinate synthase